MTVAPSLEERLAEALAAKAATVDPVLGEFDTTLVSIESAGDLGPEGGGGRPAGAGRLVRVGIAAASVAACVLVAVLVLSGRAGHRSQVSTSPATNPVTTPAATLGLAPSWLPSGLVPVSASATRLLGGGSFDGRAQLFGSSDGQPELLIEVTPGSVGGGSGTPTIVRGIAGRVSSAKEFSSSSSTVMWDEGAAVQATYRGISLAQAEAVLGSLRWSSPTDHQEGLAVPVGGSVVLMGQAELVTPSTTELEFDYADRLGSQTVGQGRQLTVRTTTAAGSLTLPYLSAWLEGTRGADGTVESYDPAFGTYSRVRTDGASIWIDANATGVSQADEERVAGGLVPATEAEFTRREGLVAATVADQLPALATADVGPDELVLRGDADQQAVCLHASGETFCSQAAPVSSGAVTGTFLIDGHWIVVGVAREPITVTPDSPTQEASSQGWSFVEAVPGPDVTSLLVYAAGQGTGMPRPAA